MGSPGRPNVSRPIDNSLLTRNASHHPRGQALHQGPRNKKARRKENGDMRKGDGGRREKKGEKEREERRK